MAVGGSIRDVQHVVILMQENRSFDHYFGNLQGVRGYNDPNILMFQNGASDLFQPNGGTNYVLPFPMTNFSNYHRMGYYSRTNLSYYYALADAYTICDANFCSFPGSTFPNRLYLFTGMIDPGGTGGGPALNNNVPSTGYSWTTYPERLQAAGISWKVYRPNNDWFGDPLPWFSQYRNATPGNPLYDRGVAMVADVLAAFKADVTNGTLPQVSWIVPPDLGASEHAPYSVETGEWFVNQALSALTANPAVYNSTVFIFNYDEEGNYFDHVPPPTAPPGTAGEYYNGSRLGLGDRVPMMIISPWTRGGRVCSQVFDHTSVIRFLEVWTGVQEPNISAWRRQVCGDLTSAFDFDHPDFSAPNLPSAPYKYSTGTWQAPPAVQILPVQEPGVRPACPLPYQPDASCYTECISNRLYVTMTNSGAASVHFAIYANAYRTDGPWHYDAPPVGSVKAAFVQPTAANGLYDFTCYGPNGFQRRMAGDINKDCNVVPVTSQINPAAAGITLGLVNSNAVPIQYTVTDTLNPGSIWVFDLPPLSATNSNFPVLANNNGWYDLTVTVNTDAHFVRHLAGHVETGTFSFTEAPFIVGNIFHVPTNSVNSVLNSIVGSIYDMVNQLIIQSSAANAGTNAPVLVMGVYDTNYALVYPGWKSNYVVEASATLAPALWTPLDAAPIVMSNYDVIIQPATNASKYFRLRR